jgi:hypothetical protein
VLIPYGPNANPGCSNRTYNNLQYLGTPIGRLIRELNSTVSILYRSWMTLITATVLCEGCQCMYSPDGYRAHVKQQRCSNTPALTPGELTMASDLSAAAPLMFHIIVSCEETTLPVIYFRTFPDNYTPQMRECLDNMIARPFLEWNSCIGVPRDVWYIISTARIICQCCHLVRSFHADQAHRSPMGLCEDVGQGSGFVAIREDTE